MRALPPDRRTFFTQHFLPGGWYDVLPIAPISEVAASLAGVAPHRLIRDSAAWLAHRDVNGVYRLLLRLASPELVASRLPRAAMQYFDFGSASGQLKSDKRFVAERLGVPATLGVWMTSCMEGFIPVAMGYAGAKDVKVRTTSEPESEIDGARLVRLSLEITWS